MKSFLPNFLAGGMAIALLGAAGLHAQNTFPSTGNVGIGTTTPTSLIHVKGSALFELPAGNNLGRLVLQRAAMATDEAQVAFNTGSTNNWMLGTDNGNNDFRLMSALGTSLNVNASSGNIGLNTTSPLTRFHVVGTTSIFTASTAAVTSAPAIRGLNGYGVATTPEFTFHNDLTTGMFHPANQNLAFSTAGVERARFLANGNLGIGTTNPATLLHVHNGILRLTGANSGGGPMVVFGGDPAGTAPNGQWGIEYATPDKGLNFWRPYLSTNGAGSGGAPYSNYVLFLSDDNRIGINTKTPTADLTVNGRTLIGDPATVTMPGAYKLYVQGGILTERVRVATVGSANWADYVFDANYDLRSLDEVESFIRENHHLPEVPSACEVEENGLDLAEMNATLLKKVEELTLYMIQQEKRIRELEAKQQD